MQQIKELNSILCGVDTELQALRAQNKTVSIGPVLVRKAQTISALTQARFLRLALGSADTEGLAKSYLGELELYDNRTQTQRRDRPFESGAARRRALIETSKEAVTGRPSPIGRSLGSFLQRRRQDPKYNDDDDDEDALSDYKYFFGRDEGDFPSSFCDSDGQCRPGLETAHDQKEGTGSCSVRSGKTGKFAGG